MSEFFLFCPKHKGIHVLCLKRSVFAPVSLRPFLLNTLCALIGQLTHVCFCTAQCVCSLLVGVFRQKLCKDVTSGCSVMSKNDRIKGGTTDKAFQGQCFLWERGAPFSRDFRLFNLKTSIIHWRKGTKCLVVFPPLILCHHTASPCLYAR